MKKLPPLSHICSPHWPSHCSCSLFVKPQVALMYAWSLAAYAAPSCFRRGICSPNCPTCIAITAPRPRMTTQARATESEIARRRGTLHRSRRPHNGCSSTDSSAANASGTNTSRPITRSAPARNTPRRVIVALAYRGSRISVIAPSRFSVHGRAERPSPPPARREGPRPRRAAGSSRRMTCTTSSGILRRPRYAG